MSLLYIDMTKVLKILPQVRPGPTYSTQSISLLLMSWRRKEQVDQNTKYTFENVVHKMASILFKPPHVDIGTEILIFCVKSKGSPTQKRKGCYHWVRWSVSSTSLVTIRAVILATFPFIDEVACGDGVTRQIKVWQKSLQWRHIDHDSVSNPQPRGCLLNRLFRSRSKKTSKLRVTGLCAGNSPVTNEFPAQRASNAENVSIWWRHHGSICCCVSCAILHYIGPLYIKIFSFDICK